MLVSIITVNFNNLEGLKRTYESVVSQTFTDYEWIVIDGGSTDGSREFIEQHQDRFAYWCSEKDNGIYHAMNKGIRQAKGEYLNFMNTGDILVFLCAIFFTVHIMVVDYYSPKTDGVVISLIQFTVCGVLCMIGAFLWGNPAWSQITSGVGTLLYSGVMSCGVAYTLQIVGQNGVNPTVAALLLSLEAVVATIAGMLAYKIGFLKVDQTMSARQIAGCVIVFAAVILVQLPKEWFEKKKR